MRNNWGELDTGDTVKTGRTRETLWKLALRGIKVRNVIRLAECSLGTMKACVSSPAPTEGPGAHACHPSTWVWRQRDQKFKFIPNYLARLGSTRPWIKIIMEVIWGAYQQWMLVRFCVWLFSLHVCIWIHTYMPPTTYMCPAWCWDLDPGPWKISACSLLLNRLSSPNSSISSLGKQAK